METDTNKVVFSIEELTAQNQAIAEELSQCQKDKEFVWNLWKRMQVEKPDMTNIVSVVIAREQEKSNEKDEKILTLLNEKDQQVKILEEIAADFQSQLQQANGRLSELVIEKSEWQLKLDVLEDEKNKLQTEIDYHIELNKISTAAGQQRQLQRYH